MTSELTAYETLRAAAALEVAWAGDLDALDSPELYGIGELPLPALFALFGARVVDRTAAGLLDQDAAAAGPAADLAGHSLVYYLVRQFGELSTSWANSTPDGYLPAVAAYGRGLLSTLAAFTPGHQEQQDPGRAVEALLTAERQQALTEGALERPFPGPARQNAAVPDGGERRGRAAESGEVPQQWASVRADRAALLRGLDGLEAARAYDHQTLHTLTGAVALPEVFARIGTAVVTQSQRRSVDLAAAKLSGGPLENLPGRLAALIGALMESWASNCGREMEDVAAYGRGVLGCMLPLTRGESWDDEEESHKADDLIADLRQQALSGELGALEV